ncbi:putative repeat protein (TIGR01451 family) [Paenibacillus cellulosilyticus]|uniref:Putative repeat protein (TIGR01451 family) n=1 Tax=Paenibacillus cellulosilyticus TaxID=375489 RepID=A0A2V2Z055_9BACL|nr:SBBP repeat-containing protein [Paenibacillus cellulosilyticus]PWW08663.1 putative repeat protein (TIGR01451 family) [Paenibacillus cellulosilyticus]QKS48227.1 DUF11 domain-containing protein [Paenibacillus cellulosilyticus]
MLPNQTKSRMPVEELLNFPLTFVQNVGQTREEIRFLSSKPGCHVAFSSEEVLFVLTRKDMPDESVGTALSLQFIGANRSVQITGRRKDSNKSHYFMGNDPANWRTDLPNYREVVYQELWPGVDLVFYGENGKFKYDVVVKPGAKLDDIRFIYRGAERLSLNEAGDLQIHTSLGTLVEEKPVSYQIIDDRKVLVESHYLVPDEQDACVYGFAIENDYRTDLELIIDPMFLLYSTYLGGSDTDIGFGIAVDNQDNAYITGQTLSLDFPIAPGAFQPGKDGSSSVFVTKVNASGTALVYSTFLGGNSSDLGRGIAIDDAGSAYVTGQTLSPDFPITAGAFQPFIGGTQDAFVTKLSPSGGSLVYSTFLGGDGVDTGFAIAVNSAGNAYVAGGTSSVNFPVINEIQPFIANEHAFVSKLDPAGSSLEYSTLLGGHGLDEARGIAVDESGDAYVTGSTTSPDFPTTPGAFQISLTGVIAVFVSRINAAGSSLAYSTYLTGNGDDEGRSIAVDELRQAYVTGSTTSFDFPATPGAFQPGYNGGASDAFVTKLSPEGNYLVYSTFLGGNESDAGNGITLRSGFAYVTGSTSSLNFPATPDAFQPFPHGGGDAFVTQLNIQGNEVVFSSYIGGSSSDVGNAIAVDSSGCVFVTGQTFSTDFPVTPGAFQPFLHGGSDAFVIRICLSLGTGILKFPDRFEVRRGETVTYTIEIQNPSAATLTNVVVKDPELGVSELIPEIPPFSVFVIKFEFVVPFDLPFGIFRNTVLVSSDQFGNGGESGEPLTADAEILVTGSPVLVAAKTVNPPAAHPEETVIFTITLENHGDADLINVHLIDPLLGLDHFWGIIAPGEVVIIEWPFIIPPDAQAGVTIVNTLTITADNLPNPEEIGTTVEVLPVPRVEITKTADRNSVFPGEIVHYTLTISNTGNVDLTNIQVFEDLTGQNFHFAILHVGQTIEFVVPFFVPLEMEPSTYVNTATVVTDQTGEPESSSTEVTVLAEPRLGIRKVSDTSTAVIGQTIQYTITLENIGNQTLTNIKIFDPVLGIDFLVPVLHVGEIQDHSFAFTIPRDTPVGSDIVNIVTIHSDQTGPEQAESIVTVVGIGLSLLKESSLAAAEPGDTVIYTLTVSNLLDVPQTNVVLFDELLGLNETIPVLLTGETITRTFSLTVPVNTAPGTVILNTFIVSSDETPQQETINEVVVVEPPGPALLIQKLPDRNSAVPGETITYTLTVMNLRNFPLTNVVLTDALLGLNETIPILLANEVVTRVFTFTVPTDEAAGSIIRNTFIVSSDQSPELDTVSEVIVEELPGPALLIQKVSDRNAAAPGETITYTLTVTNLRNFPQTNVVLTDTLLGLSETIEELPANATISRTVTFTVPAGAVPGSVIRNTFIVSSDQSEPAETVNEVIVQLPPEPALLIHKLPDRNTAVPGDTIAYTLTITNLTNIPQTNVVLTDVLLGLSETIAELPANATITLEAAFVVPADAVPGSIIRNTLIASSDQSVPTETINEVTVEEPVVHALLIQKLPDRNTASPGDTITYTLTVTNLVGIPQTNVSLSDPLLGLNETIAELPANATITLTLTFTVPVNAVPGSIIRNTLIASSDQTPSEETVNEVTVVPGPVTTLTVRKRSDRTAAEPGETIHYTIEVTNTGGIPATNIIVRDSLTGQQFTIPVIAAGETERVNLTFTVPAGMTFGSIIANRVTVTWDEQAPGSPPAQDEERVTIADPVELPELEIEATPETPRPGETVVKTITVINVTSNTLTNVRVSDSLLNFRTIIPTLAPGERQVFTLHLPVPPRTEGGTQFRNIVTIFSDQTPPQQQEVVITEQSLPDASLTETVDPAIGRPGETVFFTIRACNTGNVPLINVRLVAPLLRVQLHIERLEVGACETLRVPFVLPDVDEDTVIVSPATLTSDNGPTRTARASVQVIAEDEE